MSSKKRRKRRRPRSATSQPAVAPPPPRPKRVDPEGRPPAPWGSFPLSELAILVGAVLLVIGFFAGSGPQQATLLAAGSVIASLGALEVSVREHFAGYRSHTLLLAAIPAVIVLGLLFYLGPSSLSPLARVAIGAAVYALAAWGLITAFRARSGHAFRVKAPRQPRR